MIAVKISFVWSTSTDYRFIHFVLLSSIRQEKKLFILETNHRGHTIVVVAYRLDRGKKEREKNTEREVEGKAMTESFPVILCEQPKCSSKYAPARSNFDQSDPLQLSV